jgi:hypothetical protein
MNILNAAVFGNLQLFQKIAAFQVLELQQSFEISTLFKTIFLKEIHLFHFKTPTFHFWRIMFAS